MLDSILRFFSADAEVKFLRNKAVHVIAEYGKAKTKISRAQRKFERTKEYTVSTFQNLKKRTIDKSVGAVQRLKAKAHKEQQELDKAHAEASDKVTVKINTADLLASQVESLGSIDHPLA